MEILCGQSSVEQRPLIFWTLLFVTIFFVWLLYYSGMPLLPPNNRQSFRDFRTCWLSWWHFGLGLILGFCKITMSFSPLFLGGYLTHSYRLAATLSVSTYRTYAEKQTRVKKLETPVCCLGKSLPFHLVRKGSGNCDFIQLGWTAQPWPHREKPRSSCQEYWVAWIVFCGDSVKCTVCSVQYQALGVLET